MVTRTVSKNLRTEAEECFLRCMRNDGPKDFLEIQEKSLIQSKMVSGEWKENVIEEEDIR